MTYITPIIKCNSSFNKNDIYIKREDLIPFSFGGNKVRIAQEYFEDMVNKKKNCIVGYGNARSNLCRVLANISYSRGIACHIISPSDDNGARIETNNSRIVKTCEAIFHTCSKQNVSQKVQEVLNECSINGLEPYYIYGDIYGNGNESIPVRAYEKVYHEIKKQETDLGLEFDYIFLATGTGMTQAGLLVGKMKYCDNTKVIGISIAREKDHEIKVIKKYIDAYCKDYKINISNSSEIFVNDDYLFGGYGEYNFMISNVIKEQLLENGMPLDPIYTGKAFYGMQHYLRDNEIENKKVLFIHTGGSPLFFDYINTIIKKEN